MDGPARTLLPFARLAERIAALQPVARTETVPVDRALGRVLAEAVHAPGPLPAATLARRAGIAVRAEETLGAGPYAPAPLGLAVPVAAGAPLPAGADAVLPAEAVEGFGEGAAATLALAPGEGAIAAGAEAEAEALLLPAGSILGPAQIAVAVAAGYGELVVRAEPRVAIRFDGPLAVALGLSLGAAAGAAPPDLVLRPAGGEPVLAARPIETAALGSEDGAPALALPAGAAGWLAWWALGAPLLRRLAGRPPPAPIPARLAVRVASAVGMTDLVPVRLAAGAAEPLAAPDAPTLAAIAAADGLVVISPESEGLPAGATVAVHPVR